MKKYISYKNSQEKWLGQIPSHWCEVYLQTVCDEKRNINVNNEVSLVLSLSYGKVIRKKDIYAGLVAKDFRTYQIVEPNDIILRFTDLQNDHKSLRTGLVQEKGIITAAYTCITSSSNAAYLHYILHSYDVKKVFYGLGGGVRQSIGFKDIRYLFLPIPPWDEQDQIVRFLDWKVSSINRLINIKKKEISKLEELKRTKIATVVMGKLADEQKETAISWVHSIPTHWQEASLIQVAEEQLIQNVGLTEKNLLSLSYGKIINKDIEATEGLLPASFESYQIVNDGNIILRLTDLQNDHRSLRTGLVIQKGIITSAYTCLKTRGSVLPEYLQLQLHIADLCKVFYGMGGGVRQSIGFKEIRKLIIALPSLEEQEEIVEVVHKIENPINELIKKYKDFILLLENLKSRIISDAVTGQIDVRDVKIPSFDMVEEDLDEEKLENNDETEESGEVE